MNELKDKIVFYIEDDEFIGSIIDRRLHENGIVVTRFKNGGTVLEALKTIVPDIMILDLYLPGVNGFEILECVRKEDRLKDIPVLIVSNTDQASDRDRVEKLGAIFLVKALVSPDQIITHVKEMLGVSAK